MIIFRMRSSSEAKDLLKRVKKMSKYAEELEDVLKDCMYEDDEDDSNFRMEDEPTSSGNHYRRYRKVY